MAKTAQAVIETKVKDGASAGFQKFRNEMRKTEKQGKVLNQQFRFMRGGLGQVGHQVQDIAVQLQMGQNAMLVFGQQGSQIASLFGPQGAIIGAFLAVGAALSMSLLPRLVGATEAMKELESEAKNLIDNFDKLGIAARQEALTQAREKIADYEHAIKKANDEIEHQQMLLRTLAYATNISQKQVDNIIKAIESEVSTIERANESIAELKKKVDGVSESYTKQANALDKSTEQLRMNEEQVAIAKIRAQELDETEKQRLITKTELFFQTQREIEANKQFVESLQQQIDQEAKQEEQRKAKFDSLVTMLDMEIAKTQENEYAHLNARIAVADLTTKERDLIQAKMDKLAVIDQEKSALGAFYGWEMKTSKEKAAVMMSESSKTLGLFAKNSKKAAALQKTIQVGQALMNTYTGATAALQLPFPVNLAVAAMTIAQGLGMVSQIKAQSFEGGGFTGSGPRSGGVDGKGGFPAILHPNETVIDHTKSTANSGSQGGVIVNQTINVTTGVQQTVRAEIANLMPQIAESAQNAVLGARMRGGQYSKQLLGR
jgi:DNA repair exonuclease SbcCD ATPase subunit